MKPLYLYLSLIFLLMSCGGQKKSTTAGDKDSAFTKTDSIKSRVNGDTTKALIIPPIEKFQNYQSDALTKWIKTYLKTDEDSLDTTSCIQLLNVIGVQPLFQFSKEISGIAFQSEWDKRRYVVGIKSSCEAGDEIEFLFAINKEKRTLIKFDTYFGRACIGNMAMDAGELDNFSKFGPYYTVDMYRLGWGREGMVSIVINDDLEGIGWFDLVWMGGDELKNGEYTQYEYGYEYKFREDTMIMHCNLSGDNTKIKFAEEFDILYKCYHDSVHLLQPEQMKKHQEIIERMNDVGD